MTLQLKWTHQFQSAGFYAAHDQGYYEELGLHVTFKEGGPFDTVGNVLSGNAQYGVSNSVILLTRLAGDPVVVLSAIYQHAPEALLIPNTANIDTIQQLAGKRIRMSSGYRDAHLVATLVNEGVDVDTIIKLPDTTPLTEAMQDKTIVAFGIYAPNESYYWVEQDVFFTLIKPQTYGVDFYGDVLYTTEEEIANHPDRVRRFQEATLKGWAYALENPEQMVDLILEQYEVDKSREHLLYEAAQIQDYILPEFVEIGHINPERWRHIADTYAQLGLGPTDYSLDGFIYEPTAVPDTSTIYTILLILSILLMLTAVSLTILYLFNRQLHHLVEKQTADLKQSEARFRAVWDTSSDALALSDAQGNVIEANPAYFDLYALPPEKVQNQPFNIIFPPELRSYAMEQYHKIFKDPIIQEAFESKFNGPSGEPLIVESRYAFLTDDEGQRTAMISNIRDITMRKQAEEQVRHLSQAVEQNPAEIIITDTQGNITYVNNTFTQNSGYSFAEVKGRNPRLLKGGSRPAEEYRQLWQTILSGKHYQSEFENKKKNGEKYWVEAIIFPIKDEVDEITHFLSIQKDVSEQKRLAQEFALLEAHMQQEQRLETIGTLAGGIAHDLNNILVPIIAYTDLLRHQYHEQQDTFARLERVMKAALRAKELVQQILTFSRQQADLEVEPVYLQHQIREALTLLRSTLPANIEIVRTIAENCPPILANPSQIYQVLMNICTNAYYAMRQDGGELHLRLTSVTQVELDPILLESLSDPAYAHLVISDTGHGMDQATLARIFEPFFTTKPTGEGTGLGLSVVHGIVKSHSGAIFATSTLGEGSTFELYFPLA